MGEQDSVVESLVAREIEKAFREGWSCGYSAGLREEPESGTYWCNEERDWAESETRRTIAPPPPPA
jgi:hypothetical protein